MLYQSANRDAARSGAPDELRIDRSPNDHLAFGIGPHYCLGANLAKLEIRVLFEELAPLPGSAGRPGSGADLRHDARPLRCRLPVELGGS
jgi:hypothetical protein